MGLPITKTVTLVWDGVGWRDQETNFPVTGVKLLGMPDELVEKAYDPGVRLYDGTKVAESHHPFDSSFHVTYEQVQKMIADVLYQRTAKTHMYFGQGPEQIVTVAYHRESIGTLSHEINQLKWRLAQLERPWWKRW